MKKMGLGNAVSGVVSGAFLDRLHFGEGKRTAQVQHSLARLQALSSNDDDGVVLLADRHTFLQLWSQSGDDGCEELYSQLAWTSYRAFVVCDRYVDERMPVLPRPLRFYGLIFVVVIAIV